MQLQLIIDMNGKDFADNPSREVMSILDQAAVAVRFAHEKINKAWGLSGTEKVVIAQKFMSDFGTDNCAEMKITTD